MDALRKSNIRFCRGGLCRPTEYPLDQNRSKRERLTALPDRRRIWFSTQLPSEGSHTQAKRILSRIGKMRLQDPTADII
jgi:hypothetical protein